MLIIAGVVTLYACNSSTKTQQEPGTAAIHGEVRKAVLGSCDTTGNGSGVTVSTEIWEPTDSSAAAKNILATLRAKLIDRVNQHGDSAHIAASPGARSNLQSAFEVFQKDYLDFKKNAPDAPGCWEVGIKGDTIMATDKVLFYQLDHYSFTGGAHPNTFRSFHAFDLKTGSEVEMENYVADSAALIKLVEQHFRKTEKLSPEADLEEAGYFLLDHKFAMPVSFVFTRKGVLFLYNPYEIAAYARGRIEFTIPYEELGDIVKKSEVF